MVVDAKRLRLAIAGKCLASKEVAKRAGLCEGTIAKLSRRDSVVRPKTLGKIVKALEIAPGEILRDA